MDATACRKLGNAYTVCVPSYVDTWENGTAHNFIWNYEQPFYVSSPTISLYLYYKQNFAYNLIKNWTDMSTSSGELDVVVDDTWFPMTLPAGSGNQTLTLFGFFLPSNLNATYELTSTTSSYPRPFNFTVLRSSLEPTNQTTTLLPPLSNASDNAASYSPHTSSGLPAWAVAVITISCIVFIAAVAIIVYAFLAIRRRRQRSNKLSPCILPSQARGRSPVSVKPSQTTQKVDYEKLGMKQGFDLDSIHSTTPIMVDTGKLVTSMLAPSPTEAASSINTATSSRPTDTVSNTTVAVLGSQHPNSSAYTLTPPRLSNINPVLSSTDATLLADNFRNALYRPVEWPMGMEGEDEEENRRRLGEQLLQRQLAEDGASVKHMERRPTRIKTIAGRESKAVLEYSPEKRY